MKSTHWYQDHPRSRGEHFISSSVTGFMIGPPPLARGTLYSTGVRVSEIGITPAYAGNTFAMPGAIRSRRDHPCSRGEYHDGKSILNIDLGSPPLARGIRKSCTVISLSAGITPARAGNTRLTGESSRLDWDHPRSRGEYPLSHFFYFCLPGSPPLARGILDTVFLQYRLHGITPAYAGNTEDCV